MEQDYPSDERRRSQNSGGRKWYVWLFVAILCALILTNMAGGIIRDLFMSLIAGLTPLIVALVLSFILLRPMAFIENKLLKNCFVGNPRALKYKRAISLSSLFLILIGAFVVLIVVAVPGLIGVLEQFQGDNLTVLVDKLTSALTSLMQTITGLPAEQFDQAITDAINNIGTSIESGISSFVDNITVYLMDTASLIFSCVMGLIISFLMLKDKELISKTCKRMTYAYSNRKSAEEIITITHRTNDMFNQYIISNLIVMFIIFIIAWIGFQIMGVPLAVVMALLLGVLSIIPYLGGFIACIPLAIVTLMFGDVNMMLMALLFAIIDWALVTTFVPAFIMSKRMNTRALLIILGLTLGGAMFGLVGMILSAPIVSVISIVWQERLRIREQRREHEEMVEAGIVDDNFYGVSDILDLTQDTSYNVPIEQMDDDFSRLQSMKKANKQAVKEEEEKTDVVLTTKTTKKKKVSKHELTKVDKTAEDAVVEEVKPAEAKELETDDLIIEE
ncbi:MAG: AI-2E family transporter [Clostridia bacterium]|nr:AI-2E family transporter [Clostridia bacterium]